MRSAGVLSKAGRFDMFVVVYDPPTGVVGSLLSDHTFLITHVASSAIGGGRTGPRAALTAGVESSAVLSFLVLWPIDHDGCSSPFPPRPLLPLAVEVRPVDVRPVGVVDSMRCVPPAFSTVRFSSGKPFPIDRGRRLAARSAAITVLDSVAPGFTLVPPSSNGNMGFAPPEPDALDARSEAAAALDSVALEFSPVPSASNGNMGFAPPEPDALDSAVAARS
jgi:hypothetical protein